MSKLASSPRAGGAGPSWLRLGAAAAASATAFLLFPGLPAYPPGFLASFAVRGVLAGLVAGLALEPATPRSSPATAGPAVLTALIGALVATLALATTVRGGALQWLASGVVVAPLTAALVTALRSRLPHGARLAIALAVIAGCAAWTFGLLPGPYAPFLAERQAIYSRPVELHKNAFDGEIYLRIRERMKQGMPYYTAFQTTWTDARYGAGEIASPLNFREPGVFWLWWLLPGSSAAALLGWFIVFAMIAALAGWWLASAFVNDGAALLAPIALLSYVAFFVLSDRPWFTFAEVWSGGAIVIALALLARGRWLASAVMLVVAVAFRELALLLVPAWVLAWWFGGRPRAQLAGLVVATLGACVPVALHLALAPARGPASVGAIHTWLHSPGLSRLLRALQHGMEFVPLARTLATWLGLSALAGALLLPEARARWAFTAALVVPAVLLVAISAGPFDYYWGAMLTPVVFAFAPLVFARALPKG